MNFAHVRLHCTQRGQICSCGEGTQALKNCIISFNISGQKFLRVRDVCLEKPGSYLAIFPPEVSLQFEYTENRENWTIIVDLPAMRPGRRGDTVEIAADDESLLILPMITPIGQEHISGWEGEFMRLRDAFDAAYPIQQMRVHAGVWNIFRYVIDQRSDIYPSPVQKLRWLLDQDLQAEHNIDELSRRCGYSPSRLRALFEQEYGVAPIAYRNKRRMHIAADLLCNSDLRTKEISNHVGCAHLSYFCALFKSTFGMTPNEYQKRFRRG